MEVLVIKYLSQDINELIQFKQRTHIVSNITHRIENYRPGFTAEFSADKSRYRSRRPARLIIVNLRIISYVLLLVPPTQVSKP